MRRSKRIRWIQPHSRRSANTNSRERGWYFHSQVATAPMVNESAVAAAISTATGTLDSAHALAILISAIGARTIGGWCTTRGS
jgi:hypothetical protein